MNIGRNLMMIVLFAVALAGCQKRPETHEHEEEGIAVTAWGETYEIFAEADPLSVGRLSKSHTHVTILQGFGALPEGVVTAILQEPAGPSQSFRQEKALRDGIFSIEIQPQKAGIFELSFRVESDAGNETIPAGRVEVGEADSVGRLIEAPTYGPPGNAVAIPAGEPISFLKEQQWRTAFATAWATRGAVHPTVRGPARLRPVAGGEAFLTAPLDGTVAPGSRAHAGMEVARGAEVLRLHSRPGSGRSVEAIRSELALAEARLQRLEELLKVEAVSEAEIEEARAKVRTLSAESRAIEGGGSAVVVRAPFAGRLAEVSVLPGQAVTSGTPLARIIRTRPLWVEVATRPEDAVIVGRGISGLALRPAAGRPPLVFSAPVVRLVARAPEISPTTGSLAVILEVDSELPLSPGAALEAEIILPGEMSGMVIPASTVVDDGGIPVVYVQVEGESFIRQEIQVTGTQGDSVVVERLPEGCRIVTRGGAAIRRAVLLQSGPPEGHVH